MNDADAALVAHKTWRTLEPLHGMCYFIPEAAEEYATLGITGRDGYFASRAAPMGAVAAEVVVATFFNFNPELVHQAIPRAWEAASPEELIAARFRAVDRSYQRLLGDDVLASGDMERAATLARQAAEAAAIALDGRPLCAGHARIPWPEEPHLVLWHAQAILREFRGDGHISELVVHELSGIDALLTHAAEGSVPAPLLQSTRGWSDEAWRDATESLRSRGWLADGPDLALSDWGAAQRAKIESGTDRLSVRPYAALGAAACEELRSIARPWSKAVSEVFLRPPAE